MESAPSNPELRSLYGWLLLTKYGEYQEALEHLTFALSYQRWNPTLHLRVGLAHKGLGNSEAAIRHIKKALYWTEHKPTRKLASAALVELGVMTAEEAKPR